MNPNSTERKIIWGPFTFEFRKQILSRLLQAEKEVRQYGPDPNVLLIQPHELHQIRQLWIHEEGDWEDSLPQLYKKARGEDLDWVRDDLSGLGGKEKIILEKVCASNDLPSGMLIELINLEKSFKAKLGDQRFIRALKQFFQRIGEHGKKRSPKWNGISKRKKKMLLRSVSFKDYCLYAGEHTFNLAPRTDSSKEKVQTKPVVLFGGKNGAGKTTLLDALRLGLYGKQSFEGTISEANYKEELKSRIHISRDGVHQPLNARIAIEFDIASQGQVSSYKIDRNWELKNSKIEERLRVFKDGLLLDETETKHWPTFIAEIVPERLSQLFFFDGEKIKNIAEDISSNQSIATSIKSLLGLDIVERLKADLQIYLSTRVQVNKGKDAHNELKLGQEELTQIEDKISDLIQKKCENETTLAGNQNEIRRLKSKLSELGSDFANNQNENEARRDLIKSRLKDLESDMRAQTEKSLAFALCPKLAGRLLTQLEEEEKTKKLVNFAKESEQIYSTIKGKLEKLGKLEASVVDTFNNILNETFSPYQTNKEVNLNIIHDLPSKIIGKISQTLEASPQIAVKRVIESSKKFNQAQEDLVNTQRELEKAPKQELLKPTVDELAELGKIEGKLDTKKPNTNLNTML